MASFRDDSQFFSSKNVLVDTSDFDRDLFKPLLPFRGHPQDKINGLQCWPSTEQSSSSSTNNVTENVRVASSFHVSEIVGKQGIKIKAIRAQTNTWIKTPTRGEDPVFVISGRKEGVAEAKALILAAAEKVARLRALRMKCSNAPSFENQGDDDSEVFLDANPVQIKVIVPVDTVGLVIGPKGSRIKEIAEATNTYIKTPRKYREPVFEVVGQEKDVLDAKKRILDFIFERINDDYIKGLMTQLPIHEPGSPVKLSPTPILPYMPFPTAPTMPDEFTRLRPIGRQPSIPQASHRPEIEVPCSRHQAFPRMTGMPMNYPLRYDTPDARSNVPFSLFPPLQHRLSDATNQLNHQN